MSTVRIQIRRGTADQWTSVDPVLAAGEIGLESDTSSFKFGDGTSVWSALGYANEPLAQLEDTLADYLLITERNSAGGVAALDSQGNLIVPKDRIIIEGNTANDFETSVVATDPTADRILNLPDANGTLATQEYVTTQFQNLVDGAPTALDTLNELAAAIGDNANYAATIVTALDAKAPTANPTFTETVILPTTTSIGTVSSTEISYLDGVTGLIQDQIDELSTDVSATTAAVIKISDVNKTEVDYLIGVTSNIQDQITGGLSTLSDNLSGQITDLNDDLTAMIDLKAPIISPTFTGTVTLPLGTSIGDVSNTELQYLNGVTSSVQTQLDAKAASSSLTSHTSATTNVHGIADIADLATKTYADSAEADAITAAGTAADSKISTAVAALTKSSVGLANVDNTSDANKPVSTATQTALDAKASLAGATFTGDVTVETNFTVDGNLTVSGTTTTVNTTNFTTSDPLIYLGDGNNANLVDLGFIGSYNDGTYAHQGLAKDSSDGKWKLFKGVTDEPTTTINFAQGSLDALKVGAFEATTVTPSSGVVFSDGTQTKEGVASRTPIVQKTTSYTLSALTERDSMIEVASSSASTITIPDNASVAFPVGTSIDILQTSTGQVTIAAAGGVTVNATPGLKLRTQWSSATLFKRATDTWVVYGDLSA